MCASVDTGESLCLEKWSVGSDLKIKAASEMCGMSLDVCVVSDGEIF
jgi:hypothetical protein